GVLAAFSRVLLPICRKCKIKYVVAWLQPAFGEAECCIHLSPERGLTKARRLHTRLPIPGVIIGSSCPALVSAGNRSSKPTKAVGNCTHVRDVARSTLVSASGEEGAAARSENDPGVPS